MLLGSIRGPFAGGPRSSLGGPAGLPSGQASCPTCAQRPPSKQLWPGPVPWSEQGSLQPTVSVLGGGLERKCLGSQGPGGQERTPWGKGPRLPGAQELSEGGAMGGGEPHAEPMFQTWKLFSRSQTKPVLRPE